jgi:hypothetical protein
MNLSSLLFAALDAGEVVKLAVLILIFVVPVIGRLLAKIRQIPPPDKRPLPPRPVVPDMADQIETFMRRAAQGQPARMAKPVIVQSSSPVVAKPVQAEVVADRPVGGQVSEHVQKYLDEQKFTQREGELGKEVAQADREIDQRLHQTFDHRVSELSAKQGEAATPTAAYEPPDLVGAGADIPVTFATELLGLIGDPDSLRQAIILSEILHRPEERWM